MSRADAVGRPAVFLDRDGTIIADRHYPRDPEEVALLPGAAEAIARLNRAGLLVFVVTNQSGIGRGLLTEADFQAVQRRMLELLSEGGASVDATYHCPHAPDHLPACECRKPASGLFERAAAEHGVSLARSAFVGDRLRDILPGVRHGARSFLIRGPGSANETSEPPPETQVVGSLREAVDTLLGYTPVD